jgi:V-type H+-transporting ATPase subunit a
MFGDIGHGILMLLAVLYVLYYEQYYLKHDNGEIFGMFFSGRYVILLMAIFSIFVGFMYNETFSMAFDIFGSGYVVLAVNNNGDGGDGGDGGEYETVYQVEKESTYPFGLDPIWKQSTNELSFTNSLKMKMSIIFGVIQMLFGIILSASNHRFFSNNISLINEFIPRILFLTSIFGYMVVAIFYKWGTSYEGQTHCAPNILSMFIDMFLSFGAVNPADDDCEIVGFFEGQDSLQRLLIVIAFISVPWMLFVKPILEAMKHQAPRYDHFEEGESETKRNSRPKAEHHYDFAEEFVHQIIHTIEFVLGAVSNTASYLRLWALSLAHGQLSTVFWEKTMVEVLHEGGNPVLIIAAFMVWLFCTIGVLMIMESLSAFLHALRLHWVEFQGKFYSGTGNKFTPFHFGKV